MQAKQGKVVQKKQDIDISKIKIDNSKGHYWRIKTED